MRPFAIQTAVCGDVDADLRSPEGQSLLRALVSTADMLIENFRPGTMERWQRGCSELSAVNPRLMMIRVSGYGQSGPYAARAGSGAQLRSARVI